MAYAGKNIAPSQLGEVSLNPEAPRALVAFLFTSQPAYELPGRSSVQPEGRVVTEPFAKFRSMRLSPNTISSGNTNSASA